jgi:PST family polysaccharide transporter
LVTEIVVLGSSVVLARLIPPAEFGRAAIVRLVPMLTVVLLFEALGTLLVQRSEVGQGLLRTTIGLSLIIGTALSLFTFFVVPLIADPVFGSATTDLVRITAPTFLLAAIGIAPRVILQRRLDFRRLTLASVSALAIASVASVALALAGLGAEAIVLGGVITVGVESLLLFSFAPAPRPAVRRRWAVEIIRFGFPASLAGLAYVARRNIDYVILGAQFPAQTVGYYFRAFQVGAEYQARLTAVMRLTMFPIFSRASDIATMRDVRRKVLRVNALIAAPLLTAFVITAPVVIPLVYGKTWTPAVVPAQILSLAGLSLALLAGTEALILAAGRPQLLFRFNVAFLAAVAVAAGTSSFFGLIAVCSAIATVHVAALVAGQHYLANRVLDVSMRQVADDLGPVVLPTAALAASGLATFLAGRLLDLPDLAVLVVTLAIAGAAYMLCLRTIHPTTWAEMRVLAARVAARRRR